MNIKMKKVIIQHESGNKYQVFLSPYEIEEAETDSNFYNELTKKYHKLYEQNIIHRIEDHNDEVAGNKDQEEYYKQKIAYEKKREEVREEKRQRHQERMEMERKKIEIEAKKVELLELVLQELRNK